MDEEERVGDINNTGGREVNTRTQESNQNTKE